MKSDFSHVDISQGIGQIKEATTVLLSTPAFIKKHQLWRGFLDHKWVLIFSIVIASLFTFTLYKDIRNYFTPPSQETMDVDITIGNDGLDEIKNLEQPINDVSKNTEASIEIAQNSMADVKEQLDGDHKPLFSGSLKFLLLILLEVVIFHFAVKTNNILKEENKVLEFKDFYKAQIRMIFVLARKWVYGLLMYILVSILFGILGIEFMKDFTMFLIYGFYLGFAFLDNYLEQSGFTIKASAKCVQKHFGAAVTFGVFTSLLLYVPLVGPLVVPFIVGIAATRYGHANKIELFRFREEKVVKV